MISLGLSSADLKLFNQSLSSHHSVRVTVQILDLNHNYVGDLTDYLLDGQVTIDADAEVTRTLTVVLNDPDRRIQLDSTNPNDGALFYDRMLRIIYSIKSEILPRWVDVPIFCGPVTKMARTADVINVECQGKESLVLPPAVAWYARSWGKGMNRVALVRTIMATWGGETRFSFPEFTSLTPGVVTMTAETNVWQLAKQVNGSFSWRQIYYDGRGVLVMRDNPRTPVYTFRTGTGGNVTTQPTIDYDISAVRNVIRVKGAIPKGKKAPVTAAVGLPSTHPLNHHRMGRNGKPRVLLEVITDDNIKTTTEARTRATNAVRSAAVEAMDVKFDAFVAPHLEPNDLYTLRTPDFSVLARYKQAVIPLKSAVGSVGYHTRAAINRTRIRRR